MSKKIALFPGQGSQYIGMGQKISEEFSPAKDLLNQANEILGINISKIMFEGPEDELKQTQNTQPALFVCSAMVDLYLKSQNISTDYVAGHSLGEYSAIYSAGGFDFEAGLKLVRLRGELMASAGDKSPGAMSAIVGMSDEHVIAALSSYNNSGVVAANFNCPGQVVVSGEVDAVKGFGEVLSEQGKRVIPLPVSGAFHSPLMEFAVPGLTEGIEATSFKSLNTPLIANVSAELVTEPEVIKSSLVSQLTGSVLWTKSMEKAVSLEVTEALEVGAGKVLFGLMRKISRGVKVKPVESSANL